MENLNTQQEIKQFGNTETNKKLADKTINIVAGCNGIVDGSMIFNNSEGQYELVAQKLNTPPLELFNIIKI